MSSNAWSKIRTIGIVVLVSGASFACWAHFARKGQAAKEAVAQARVIEEANRRYPVKGRRTKERAAPLPPPADGSGLEPAALPERPRMRISRAEE